MVHILAAPEFAHPLPPSPQTLGPVHRNFKCPDGLRPSQLQRLRPTTPTGHPRPAQIAPERFYTCTRSFYMAYPATRVPGAPGGSR